MFSLLSKQFLKIPKVIINTYVNTHSSAQRQVRDTDYDESWWPIEQLELKTL